MPLISVSFPSLGYNLLTQLKSVSETEFHMLNLKAKLFILYWFATLIQSEVPLKCI